MPNASFTIVVTETKVLKKPTDLMLIANIKNKRLYFIIF